MHDIFLVFGEHVDRNTVGVLFAFMEDFESESVTNSSLDETCVGHEGHLLKCESALVFLSAAEE